MDERKFIKSSLLLTLVHFGNHGLHHLLPSLDHAALQELEPDFKETCKDFNIILLETTWIRTITGFLKQLARTDSIL